MGQRKRLADVARDFLVGDGLRLTATPPWAVGDLLWLGQGTLPVREGDLSSAGSPVPPKMQSNSTRFPSTPPRTANVLAERRSRSQEADNRGDSLRAPDTPHEDLGCFK